MHETKSTNKKEKNQLTRKKKNQLTNWGVKNLLLHSYTNKFMRCEIDVQRRLTYIWFSGN